MAEISRAHVVDACRYFDSWVAFRLHAENVPGVQAAVLHEDDVVLSTAHGVSSVATDEPLTDRHLFRIASHSKTFTATAVMQLVERGVVRLDDTVVQWIPDLVESPISSVTVRELVSHAGGVIRDGRDGDFWQLYRSFPDRSELLRVAAADAAVLPRNERFKYSNIGFSLLGLVIEAASAQSYNDYVAEHIVGRLGLLNTGPEYVPSRAPEYAGGHSALSYADTRIPIDHVDTAAMAPATGFFSTASDLVQYTSAHFEHDERLLGDDAKRQMQHAEWDVGGTDTSYGLGFAIATIGDRRVLGHGGGYPGHITRTFFDPVDRLSVSVLTNAIDGPALAWATAAIRLIDLAAADQGGERRPSDELAPYCGRYASLWGVYDIVALGGRLYQLDPSVADPVMSPTRLEVIDDATLGIASTPGYGSRGERISYEFADDGSVASVRAGSGTTALPIDAFRDALQGRVRVGPGDPIRH
jgi:CubicO group peptidase (beta-lactamase class C family)